MYEPPPDPRHRSPGARPTWRQIVASYALIAAVPLALWVVEHPLTGVGALAVAVGLSVGLYVPARGTVRLVRCLDRCRECTLDLPGTVRITITTHANDAT